MWYKEYCQDPPAAEPEVAACNPSALLSLQSKDPHKKVLIAKNMGTVDSPIWSTSYTAEKVYWSFD